MKANNRRKVFGDAVDLLMEDIEKKTAPGGLRMLSIKKIRPFHNHPFHLYEGERLEDMVASVREYGILNPVIVQEIDGGYEMLSGHNRMNAAKLVGLKEIPAIVKTDLSEEEAYVYVIETNLMQRSFSDLLISEKAAVLKARYEKESCQGRRNDIIEEIARMEGKELPATCGHGDQRLNTRDMIGKEYELSGSSVASNLKFVDKVLFVVDRKDLDYQTMKEYDRFEKGAANSNSSTVILERQLRDSKAHIIITTIQKLSSFIKKYKEHAVYNKQVVIIFDECHRSQFGDMHAAIVRNFKKYYMFGFTGTPIFPENSGSVRNPKFFTTEQTFGDQLHTYTIVDAINDKNVLPFRVDYIKTMDTDADIDDEQVWDIDRKKAFEAPERITLIAKYILEHFDQKTYRGDKTYVYNALTNIAEVASADRGKVEEIKQKQRISGFNSIFAVSSVPMAKLYYDEFRRQIKADPTKNLKIAVIYSYGTNEEEADGILDEENPEDTSALDQTARDFLDSAIFDYNQLFHTNYDTSSDKFQNYYKDVSLRMKNKELDLLIVVNMFLTGFDATTLNTLWVDKNLKMHGLIQAFSRTNRILNSIKTFGNIVCFRNLQKRVDAAISLFGDKNAGGIVLMKSFKDYYYGCESIDGKPMPGYVDMIEELSDKFPLTEPQIIGEQNQKDFIALFGAILRMRNLLLSFDEFAGKEGITERDLQDYLGRYQDLRDEWKRKRENGESVDIIDDIVFEVELIKQIEINIDYILMLVKKYHDTHGEDKEVLITIKKAIDASPELRSKKALIENFISGINDMDDVMLEWKEYVVVQRERDLENIIEQEKLKPNEARKFLENCFREGEVKTTGTDIDKLMPPVSRFGGSGARAKKKKKVIDLLRAFFEKYSGLGMATFKAKQEEDKVVTYDFTQQPMSMVAESPVEYGKKD